MMPKMPRRDFLKLIPFGLGMSALSACQRPVSRSKPTDTTFSLPAFIQGAEPTTTGEITIPELRKISLGVAGLQVSPLAFGTGTHGVGRHSDQSALGIDSLAELLVEAYHHGVNFWDAADAYGTHPHLARALQSLPRDKVVILTKTMSRNAERVWQDIERFLLELGTDVIDIVLLHVVTTRDWTHRLCQR